MTQTRYYQGCGTQTYSGNSLPKVNPQALRTPEDYRAGSELAAAVDTALTLGMPLLLTGEPGSGKSGLAYSLAWELGLDDMLHFPVKSDTESRDLFYRFDTVGRFHAAQSRNSDADEVDPAQFLRFEALGQAILLAKEADALKSLGLPARVFARPGGPRRSVVLIDEIDKAPRDVPNDILVEIEMMQFDIPELSAGDRELVRVGLQGGDNHYRPIVVFTSNSEKALPDPFLRRCVFHHLGFPKFRDELSEQGRDPYDGVTVETIVIARLAKRYNPDARGDDPVLAQVETAISLFRYLRLPEAGLDRRPALAELLDWLNCLMPPAVERSEWHTLAAITRADGASQADLERTVANLLLKNPPDQRRVADLMSAWRQWRERRSEGGR
jgi:MoxR-like ATPase